MPLLKYVSRVWRQGTTSNPKGCSIPMWWRQSGQVNTVLFCPLYFLLVHINNSPCGGATCYKSSSHVYFLNVLLTLSPNVLDVMSCLQAGEPSWHTLWFLVPNINTKQTRSNIQRVLADCYLFSWQPILLQQILFQITFMDKRQPWHVSSQTTADNVMSFYK